MAINIVVVQCQRLKSVIVLLLELPNPTRATVLKEEA